MRFGGNGLGGRAWRIVSSYPSENGARGGIRIYYHRTIA